MHLSVGIAVPIEGFPLYRISSNFSTHAKFMSMMKYIDFNETQEWDVMEWVN